MNKKFHVIKGEHFSETFWNPLYQKVMDGKGTNDEIKLVLIHSFWNNLTSNTTLYGKCDEETKEYLEYVFNDVLEKLVENDDVKDIVKKFKECLVYEFEISPEAQWNLFQNWMWFNDKDNLCKNRNYCFEDVINDVSSHYGRIFNFAIHTSEIYFK
jgi:hypothetical protein